MDTRTGEIFRYDEPMDREKRRRMERAAARDDLVEVSGRVAELMEGALAREEADRKRKRKAQKQARKNNR